MAESYKTLEKSSCDEFVVKKSHFIGYAAAVKTNDEAAEFINSIKAKHRDATHNVYAYCLREGQTCRYSDDGEPQGTAGLPMLTILKNEGLTDCVVVGTRYFGGILLGANGLVRAYSVTAKIAIQSAGIITMAPCKTAEIVCDYNFYGKLQTVVSAFGIVVEETDFSDLVRLSLKIPCEVFEKFDAEVFDKSLGKVRCKVTGEKFSKIK